MERAARPFHVCLIVRQNRPEPISGKGSGDPRQLQYLRHHQQHDETAIRIQGDVTRYRPNAGNGFLYGDWSFRNSLHMLPTKWIQSSMQVAEEDA